jgi:hypothetical protein
VDVRLLTRRLVSSCGVADLSLIMGRTVRQAFEVATTTASSETGPLKEQQFMLLPPEGDHDLVVFDDVQVGEHTGLPISIKLSPVLM